VVAGASCANAGCADARLRIVIGDLQAPSSALFAILEHRGLLGDDGWLRPDVQLFSIGDYFDYGGFEQRQSAAESGLATLSWLAAHSSDQVVLIAGNHDLGRVGELIGFDDERFHIAAERAAQLYGRGPDPRLERQFLREFPELPSVEVAARDFAAFSAAQRALVTRLLRERRLRLAAACNGLMLSHAGATADDLAALHLEPMHQRDASVVARRLNDALDRAVAAWDGAAPLHIPGLHAPGSSHHGEGGGMLYHRPHRPTPRQPARSHASRRRFDPRRLPVGLTQVVGHTRDEHCRSLLADWVADVPGRAGALRQLVTDGARVTYGYTLRAATADEAALIFTDGGMNDTPPEYYELLDLDRLQPLQAR
jgi:hypothetical protein